MIAERHNQLLLHRLSDVRSCWPLRHSAVRVHVYNRRLGGSYLAWHVQLQRTGNHGRVSQNSRGAGVADCLSCLVLSCLPAVPAILSRVVSRALLSLSFQASSRPRVLTTDVGVGGRVSPLTASSNVWLSTVESRSCALSMSSWDSGKTRLAAKKLIPVTINPLLYMLYHNMSVHHHVVSMSKCHLRATPW